MICPVCGMEMEQSEGMLLCRSPNHAVWEPEGLNQFGNVVIFLDDPDRYWDARGSHLVPVFQTQRRIYPSMSVEMVV